MREANEANYLILDNFRTIAPTYRGNSRRDPSHRDKNVPRNDDFSATFERILREGKGEGKGEKGPPPSGSFRSFPPPDGEYGERRRNENVQRDRIIHCPTETDGASRLFGERIFIPLEPPFDAAIRPRGEEKYSRDLADPIFGFLFDS